MREVLFTTTFIDAAVAIFALSFLLSKPRVTSPAILLWVGHVALFWTVIFIMRLFFGYVGPSAWVSTWASLVWLHGVMAIVLEKVVVTQTLKRREGKSSKREHW